VDMVDGGDETLGYKLLGIERRVAAGHQRANNGTRSVSDTTHFLGFVSTTIKISATSAIKMEKPSPNAVYIGVIGGLFRIYRCNNSALPIDFFYLFPTTAVLFAVCPI